MADKPLVSRSSQQARLLEGDSRVLSLARVGYVAIPLEPRIEDFLPIDDLSVVKGFKQVWADFYRATDKQVIRFLEE